MHTAVEGRLGGRDENDDGDWRVRYVHVAIGGDVNGSVR